MLQLDHETWMRPRDDPPHILRDKMKQFLEMWEPFDWTSQLDEEENIQ